MKKVVTFFSKYFVIGFIVFSFFSGTVYAASSYESWAGIVYWNNWVGLDRQTKTSSSSKTVSIHWNEAEAKNFYLNLRILNDNLSEVDNTRLNYLGSTSFHSPTVSGRTYILQGQRDGYFTPSVYVKGTWKIN